MNNNETNQYKDMSFEDFITNVLGLELNESQKHLVKIYEELKGKGIIYQNPSIFGNGHELFRNTLDCVGKTNL